MKWPYITRGTEEPVTGHKCLVTNFPDFIYLFLSNPFPCTKNLFWALFTPFDLPGSFWCYFKACTPKTIFFILIQATYHCKPHNQCFKWYVYCFKLRGVLEPILKLNKPSFCPGSCDEIYATKLQKKLNLKILDTPLKRFMKFSWNTLDYLLKHPWNFLKTSLKQHKNSLKQQMFTNVKKY